LPQKKTLKIWRCQKKNKKKLNGTSRVFVMGCGCVARDWADLVLTLGYGCGKMGSQFKGVAAGKAAENQHPGVAPEGRYTL
jgi:hypothetical protein